MVNHDACTTPGGAGKYRGGLGILREYRPIGHNTTFSGQGERFVNRPWGLFGGKSGGTGLFSTVSDSGEETRLANKPSALRVGPENVIRVVTAGAGGFGDPLERSDTDLIEDKNSGKFSEDFLTKEYPQWENLSNLKK